MEGTFQMKREIDGTIFDAKVHIFSPIVPHPLISLISLIPSHTLNTH
jgi:hypothetical protein